MRGDIELAGLVLTAEEWAALDRQQRAMLLRAGRDEPWIAAAPPRPRPVRKDDDAYEAYEIVPAPA
ncbi:MAG TPA: hypothetical protein VM734_22090 [Kofleriaceae bacterium]|nr:hypothetical protein [Kofleriaceae bacterium]